MQRNSEEHYTKQHNNLLFLGVFFLFQVTDVDKAVSSQLHHQYRNLCNKIQTFTSKQVLNKAESLNY